MHMCGEACSCEFFFDANWSLLIYLSYLSSYSSLPPTSPTSTPQCNTTPHNVEKRSCDTSHGNTLQHTAIHYNIRRDATHDGVAATPRNANKENGPSASTRGQAYALNEQEKEEARRRAPDFGRKEEKERTGIESVGRTHWKKKAAETDMRMLHMQLAHAHAHTHTPKDAKRRGQSLGRDREEEKERESLREMRTQWKDTAEDADIHMLQMQLELVKDPHVAINPHTGFPEIDLRFDQIVWNVNRSLVFVCVALFRSF